MRHFAFLAVLFACSVASAAPGVTMENYNKIVPGASIGFVYGCLGKETSVSSQSGKRKALLWREGAKTIRVRFEKDEVVGKSATGLK